MNYLKYKVFFSDKTNLLGLLISFLAAYILFPNYFHLNITPLSLSKELWMSLDPSWVIALNYVKINGVSWGADIAFTYGPLAQLFTRASWGENKFTFFIFDLFVFSNYFFLFYFSFLKSKSKILTFLIIFSICLLTPLWMGSANALVLMAFLIFWISISIEKFNWLYYFFQIIIIIILFFGKFNTGLIALPLFYGGLIYSFFTFKEIKKQLVILSILPILFITLLSFPFNVNLVYYIKSGFEIIKGYNDVMFLNNQLEGSLIKAIYLIIIVSIIISFNIFISNKFKLLKSLLILFLFGTSFYVLYKQSFVRADMNHIKDFFIFFPLLVLCNTNLYLNSKSIIIKTLLIITVSFSIYFLFSNFDDKVELITKINKKDYIETFKNFETNSELKIFDNNFPLPENIIKKIGKKTIDIFPWNIQLLLENKLNYLPRPVFQSYSSYTSYLDKLNFDHYNSSKAPEFVLYDYASIDERYPLYDESKVNMLLLKNYNLVDDFEYDSRKMLLLQKKKQFKQIEFIKKKEYAMLIDSPLIMEEEVFYEIYLYHSIKGRIVSLLEYAPEVSIEMIDNKGFIKKYKSSKLLLESGIYSSFIISNTEDFKNLIQKKETDNKMKGLFFRPLDLNSFDEKIRIIEYKIN